LEVANVTDVGIDIRNIGLLMFSEYPEKFMPGAKIELIRFNSPDAEASDDFTEKTFTGPLQKQIRDVLEYMQTTLIDERVVKIENHAEAERYFNYPYNALEEAVVNSVFHKSYREQEPVEIRIYTDCVKIINYPGPAKWIDMEKFRTGKVVARRYRNRRIGEFLKEIDLSEKKSTGISKILRTLTKNGSPVPDFETDEDRNYLITTLKIHEAFGTINNTMNEVSNNERSFERSLSEVLSEVELIKVAPIVKHLQKYGSISPKEARQLIGKSSSTVRRYLSILCNCGILTVQGKTNSLLYVLNNPK
jgi:ATP-dependent DNA helicase RecG